MIDWALYLSFAGGILVGAGITLVFALAAIFILLYRSED
jgi:hypothetical protein